MIAAGVLGEEGAGGSVAAALPSLAPVTVQIVAASDASSDVALAAAWCGLATAASEPNPFVERWYLKEAINALPEGRRVELAIVSNGGDTIGIAPLARERHYAGMPLPHMRNWLNHNAFLGTPLVRSGREDEFWAALLDTVDGMQSAGLFLHLEGLPVDGKLTRALERVCAAQNRRIALVHREERALLEHGFSPDAYLEANMRGKKRKELRRQHNRLAELGKVECIRGNGGDGLDAWVDEFLVLERRGWKGANGSALDCADETRQLFRGALAGAARAGKLELLALRLDGRAIAMLVNFITPPGAFSFKTAFDEDYARFSPGVLLQLDNLKLLDRADVAWCDSCAAQDHPMIDSIWSGRRAIGRYSVAIGGRANRAAFAALLAAEKAKARLRKINAAKSSGSDG
jgi:CelD/BcsL family acetyltransferase involved in cellulose biosynthesis